MLAVGRGLGTKRAYYLLQSLANLPTYCLPVGRGRCTTRVRAHCTARRRSTLAASSLPVARAHAIASQARRVTPGAV
eukprot:scaffold41637_cov59-Phaeocystis_antarctica.AAC.2